MHHVLIIEDEPAIAALIQDLLSEEGIYSVSVAATQVDAIRLSDELAPQLIIADVRIKAGTGPAAVAAIAAKVGRVPVIYMTGNDLVELSAEREDVVLRKPFTYAQFSKRLARGHCRTSAGLRSFGGYPLLGAGTGLGIFQG